MNLLDYIWAAPGYRVVGYPNPKFDGTTDKRRWLQRFYTENEPAYAQLAEWQGQGLNVYYAPAVFKTANRDQDNALYAASLWCDLDIRPDNPKCYATPEEATTAIALFCTKYNLEVPTLVWSGAGFHCYWLLSEFVYYDQWIQLARSLKRALADSGVKQDAVPTANMATWLRPMGYRNFKRNADVQVLSIGTVQAPAAFANLPTSDPLTDKHSVMEGMVFDTGPKPLSNQIAERCKQMAHIHDVRGNVPEPLWYAALGVLVHCEDAGTAIHEWSNGHPSYDGDATERKARQWLDRSTGPSLCASFKAHDPSLCAGCPFVDKIKTPAQLGKEAPPAETLVVKATDNTTVGRYKLYADSVVKLPEDENEKPKRVLGVPLRVEGLAQVGIAETRAIITWLTPQKTPRRAELPLRTLSEGRELEKWLLTHNIVEYYDIKEVFMFIKNFIQQLNSERDPEGIAEHMGWQTDDSFVLGDRLVTATETKEIKLDKTIGSLKRDQFKVKGSKDVWVETTRILGKPGYEALAFALLAGFAAPLFQVSRKSGAVVSLAGASGAGKTISIRYGLSVWSDPAAFFISPQGTANAKDNLFKTAANLPLVIDDISGPLMRNIKGLIYTAANGVAKETLTKDRELREQSRWCTLVALTTNNSIMDLPSDIVTDAEKCRTLEITFDTPVAPADGATLSNVAEMHYGHAGEPFIRYVIKHRAFVAEMCDKAVDHINKMPGVNPANRYGIWLCALALVAGRIARKLHLIQFDPEKAVEYALKSLRGNISTQRAPSALMRDLVAEYIQDNWGKIARKTERLSSPINLDLIDRGAIKGCIRQYNNTVAISVADLNNLLQSKSVDSSVKQVWMREHNIKQSTGSLIPDGPIVRYYIVPFETESLMPTKGVTYGGNPEP